LALADRDSITVEIHHIDAHAVFDLAFAKGHEGTIASADIVRDHRQRAWKQDVTVFAAIHHRVRHVYSGASILACSFKINDLVHGTACDAHLHAQFRMVFSVPLAIRAHIKLALPASAKYQRSAIACWHRNSSLLLRPRGAVRAAHKIRFNVSSCWLSE